MIYKTYFIVLILVFDFYFGDVFGNIILIGQEPEIHIINMPNKTRFNYDAKMIPKPGCFTSSVKTVLQCGRITIDFLNDKNIFAEIFLNYNERVVENPKIKRNLKITFGEQNIILKHKRKQGNFTYDECGIQNLMAYITNIDEHIQFEVVKIYESNLPNNRTLAHSTVYDNRLKMQLHKIEELSIWPYVKEEIVNVDISTQPNITLEDFINNSTKYKKNVVFTLEKALRIMNDRIFKYAFLLLVYAHIIVNYVETENVNLELIKKVSEILSKAQIFLINSNNIEYSLQSDFKILHNCFVLSPKKLIYDFMLKYSKLFLTSEETSDFTKTQKLPQVFEGFPKPHENNIISYNFETIPREYDEIKIKFDQIIKLITTECINIFDITYNPEENQ
ncbi:uncharacterized protein LOC126906976 [Daktulosphaira vitifoliae]|uniref:uncharacterized protein LOC126906976 n=1 Tax=Daktulosphaira vitifoliae TaxID=58002 RepID=UPI0021AAFD87|nr:uncharacterized protein LOC126906976 [Daktulosphaira vitifoliae]